MRRLARVSTRAILLRRFQAWFSRYERSRQRAEHQQQDFARRLYRCILCAMSGRSWLSHPFIGTGLILVVGVGAIASYRHYHNPGCAQYPPAKECQGTADKLKQRALTTPRAPDPNPKPKRDEWRSERDLQAQWKMAEATWDAAYAAWVAVGMTAIGIFLVWLNLVEARKAVAQAAKGTRAAEAAVEVTTDTAQRQLRAYVHLQPEAFTPPGAHGGQCRGNFSAINTGATPAYDVTLRFAMLSRPYPDHGIDFADEEILEQYPTRSIIGGGGDRAEYPLVSQAEVSRDELIEIRAQTKAIYVFGLIAYRDIYRIKRSTRFRFIYGGERGIGGLWICPDGNDADQGQ